MQALCKMPEHTSLLVSSIRLCSVAVKVGGNCGGFLYMEGAMLLFISGRWCDD